MKTKLLLMTALVLSMFVVGVQAQTHNITEAAEPQGKTIVFRFVAESDTFYIPYQGNGEKHKPMLLTADLNTPVEAGITATINNWISEGRGGTAN